MKQETLIWTRAKHPNIHTFLGFRVASEPQLIGPWCKNGNLSDYLVFNPQLSTYDKLRLIHQSALGLTYLHNLLPPICHGDIKPENILINDSGEAAISDFGLSRVIESLEVHTGLTTSGGTKGTFVYCAPELAVGLEDRPTCESDVYSFGGLTLSVMSGEVPYHGIKSAGVILKRIMEGKVPQPSDHKAIPGNDTLWSLMRNCWKNEASDRPSMRDVITEVCTVSD
ncbi:hypothetical protein M407DRAFT_79803 [Tulasnella calospora MUT 4182]|uniref:Protein kinase domain-containing protein n=1 Tax=Tulasnella calospora MUT 4182 TaxID=1051891 RepID=A0A0C3KKL8_9AGAM|nr:hypothetical protein M407DRAFT_79803 [Tulasnella calospora MUT 4182]